jgi:release factor glutamine methyltransferase
LKKIWRILDLINWGKNYFEEKGIDDARLNIELLLAFVLNCDRLKLYLDFDKPVNQDELNLLKSFIKRRARHEPIQYIIGFTQFYNQKILVNNEVLIPRPETEELVEIIVNKYKNIENLEILDIGCGSGCIGIALANELKNSFVTGIDIKDSILDISRKNAEINHVNNIIFNKMDILKHLPNTKFDIVVSNPPYIPENEISSLQTDVSMYEPISALSGGIDGLVFYRRLYEIIFSILCENGNFFFEFGFNQNEILYNLFSNKFDTVIYKDFNGLHRFISGRKI